MLPLEVPCRVSVFSRALTIWYVVDRSSLLLACYDGRPGGTMNTILYAQRSGVQVIVLDVE